MLFNKKKNFFERLTGTMKMRDEEYETEPEPVEEKESRMIRPKSVGAKTAPREEEWAEEPEEGQLTVDVYQTPTEIVVKTMVAGVRPEDLSINIARDMITIRGKREEAKNITEDNYFIKELYWGSFSRTILLPQEVELEDAEAIEKHGLLEIHLPKIDKEKRTNLKVKSL